MHMSRSHHKLDMLDCHLDHSSDIFEKDLGHCLTSLSNVRLFCLPGLSRTYQAPRNPWPDSVKILGILRRSSENSSLFDSRSD